MEAGRLAIERARLSASGLIVEAVDMQRSLASSSSLELRSDVDSDVPEVWGDWDRLLQVFENPTGNAIKFTTAGGCITVGATSRDHEVIFRVADTGSVITPQNLPVSLTDFGKPPGQDVRALGSAFRSPKASSSLTADASGSRARRIAARPSPLRFPRQLQSRVDRRGLAVLASGRLPSRLDQMPDSVADLVHFAAFWCSSVLDAKTLRHVTSGAARSCIPVRSFRTDFESRASAATPARCSTECLLFIVKRGDSPTLEDR